MSFYRGLAYGSLMAAGMWAGLFLVGFMVWGYVQ